MVTLHGHCTVSWVLQKEMEKRWHLRHDQLTPIQGVTCFGKLFSSIYNQQQLERLSH